MSQIETFHQHTGIHVRQSPLTLQEMEKVIKDGGSVMYRGRIINALHHLPHPADLALGDPAKEKQVETDLVAQMDKLREKLDLIRQSQVDSLNRMNAEGAGAGAGADPSKAAPGTQAPPGPRVVSGVTNPVEELKQVERAAVLAGAPEPHDLPPVQIPPASQAAAAASGQAPEQPQSQQQQPGNKGNKK
jgi:hypothetical protein